MRERRVTTTYEANGEGPLTVGDVAALVEDVPHDAELCVRTWDDQRDGAGWRLTATVRP